MHRYIDYDYVCEKINLNNIKKLNDYMKTQVESSGLHPLEPKLVAMLTKEVIFKVFSTFFSCQIC